MSWLGILDVGGSVAESVELGPLAERLGYTRYWIAEHQPQPSPILIASLVAGQTERIRVGTAGVLLHYYPPLRTAHDFQMLELAFSGRIDAGFCAGLAAPHLVELDRDGRDVDAIARAFPQRAEAFVGYLRNTHASPAFDPSTAWPSAMDEPPQIWWHGSSERSAAMAARVGTSYGYALQFSQSIDDPSSIRRYRDEFVSHRGSQPRAIVAVAGVCAETEREARALADAVVSKYFAPRIVGTPEQCAELLAGVRERYHADEVIFADLCNAFEPRARCYELLAAAALANAD